MRVDAENLLARFGVHRARGGYDTLHEAAAKPEFAAGIEIVGITHAEPHDG